MRFSTLIKHSAELLRIIMKSATPADELASQYLRAKKYIGSTDRKIISEIVFSTLRTHSLAAKAVEEFEYESKTTLSAEHKELSEIIASIIIVNLFPNSPLANLHSYLAKLSQSDAIGDLSDFIAIAISELQLLTDTDSSFAEYCTVFATKFLTDIESDTLLSAKHLCLQSWMIDSLARKYSNRQINQLAFTLMYPASVCLRINTLNANRESILEELEQSGITAKASKYSPVGIILDSRPQLNNYEFFRNGSVEVQDIGSQIIAYALNPESKSRILDACAGAGGKTLHIAAITNDDADIIATDIEYNRLKEIRNRADKSGISCIEVVPQRSMELKTKIKYKFDSILIDAPCSGMGTVRRMPMPKWRLSPKQVMKLNKAQTSILEYYADMLEVGGSLVYATCSLLIEENEQIIQTFLAQHDDFAPSPIKPILTEAGIDFPELTTEDFMLSTTPLNNETDGFFMSRITKIK